MLRRPPRPATDDGAVETGERRGAGKWVLLALLVVVIAGAVAVSVWQWRKSRTPPSAGESVDTTRVERRVTETGFAAEPRDV